ncbi:MAG TPA: DNA mismatch repair endonuclease MutL, partial [Lacipirellulaceae bacterium]|nr:DNA mismatch repair endonuclease MutL [Lacipirellulaceae bacterium]
DDLFRVATLGFRGEALASIGAVSRMLLRSRPSSAESAAELEIVGGPLDGPRPAAGPPGTLIDVRRLFFNTPVRQKFLRTTSTEMGHVSEAVARLALAHPNVHITLTHGSRVLHDLPPCDARQRVAALFGEELAGDLIAIESQDGEIRLWGYVANPSHSRPTNRMQYVFLNGRHIRDRSLQHALGEAYRGLLLTGRYPVCFLHLELPPAAVDVNVHPTKLEVRFQDGGRIYSHLLGTLRTKFLATDLVARGTMPGTASGETPASGGDDEISAATAVASDLWEWARRQTGPVDDDRYRTATADDDFAPATGQGLQLHEMTPGFAPPAGAPAGRRGDAPHAAPQPPSSLPRALQIHNRYLVAETEDGLEVIDQHALHERILYEGLRSRVASGAVESQRLLAPEPVDLAPSEAAAALEHRALLSQLGIEVEPFGGDTVVVTAYPAMLANFAPADVLRSVVEQLAAGARPSENRDLADELLHMIACKAAVKYGDRLSPQEIDALLVHRGLARDHHHCPHGRPTALVFTREQLDRQFKRI